MKNFFIIMLIACLMIGGLIWLIWPGEGDRDDRSRAGDNLPKTEKEKPMFTNALIHETSPYLLQHAHNPVDWMPWGKAAFEKAKREDKPIFLSIGYSTCHWCHVMAHESFENEEVAKILNEHFVSIKVDREELPDVDEQYMLASQLITRRGGGWPNSVWLTPEKKPWFAGTYFPREDRGEMPGFKTLLLHLADTWKKNRPQIEGMADRITEVLRSIGARSDSTDTPRPLQASIVDSAIRAANESFDASHGGFGSRPKFPPHATLSLLIHQYQKNQDPKLLKVITKTLKAMSLGGVYDHVGGGFHRYSTDQRWFLPHFEKMLYDNGQLIRIYADGYVLTGRKDFGRVVQETFRWIQREMTDPAGGFYSALDADSLNDEGHAEEGKFYVWTPKQVIDTLGKADSKFFNMIYGITKEGNFQEEASGRQTGDSIPFLAMSIEDVAMGMKFEAVELHDRLGQMRNTLLVERAKRHRPHLDDKVLTGWNGLMIEGLAHAGRVLEEPEYVNAAARAATFVLENLRDKDGRLLRTWRAGRAKLPAYLTDYSFFIQGLLELHQATNDQKWLDEAVALAERMIDDFRDSVRGGFFFTSESHDPLLLRSTGMTGGGNIPSGNAVAARVLTRLAVLTGELKYATAAEGVFKAHSRLIWEQPEQNEHLILAWAEYFESQEAGKLPKVKEKADTTAGEGPVHVAAFVAHDQVKLGESFEVTVRVQIDKPWHIYSDKPGSNIPVKTELTLEDTNRAVLASVRYPKPESFEDAVTGEMMNMFTGQIALVASIRLLDNEKNRSGDPIGLILKLKAQACDAQRCLLPKTYELLIRVKDSEKVD